MTKHRAWPKWVVAGMVCWLGFGAATGAQPNWENVTAQLRGLALPDEAVDILIAQARQRGVHPAAVLEWHAAMVQAKKAGLPPGLMSDRISQGLAKGVPAERITQALDALHNNLVWAKQLIEAHVAKAEVREKPARLEQALQQIDAALRAGLARPQLEQIFDRTKLTLEQCTALARTAADLRGFGAEPVRLARILQSAGRAGLTAAELDRMARKFTRGQSAGRSLPDLLTEFEQGIKVLREHSHPNRDELREEMKRDTTQRWRDTPPAGGSIQDGGTPSGGSRNY